MLRRHRDAFESLPLGLLEWCLFMAALAVYVIDILAFWLR